MARKPYIQGEYKVMCDICGCVRYASQTALNKNNERVCIDTCMDKPNPQDMPIRIRAEKNSVDNPRPFKVKEDVSLTDWSKL